MEFSFRERGVEKSGAEILEGSMADEKECCLCLRTEKELRDEKRTLERYGLYLCCPGCVASAVAHAYDGACRFGGAAIRCGEV